MNLILLRSVLFLLFYTIFLFHLTPSSSHFRLASLWRGSASLPGKTDWNAVAPTAVLYHVVPPLGSAPSPSVQAGRASLEQVSWAGTRSCLHWCHLCFHGCFDFLQTQIWSGSRLSPTVPFSRLANISTWRASSTCRMRFQLCSSTVQSNWDDWFWRQDSSCTRMRLIILAFVILEIFFYM